jgi:iron complex transport system ATP-binding protein
MEKEMNKSESLSESGRRTPDAKLQTLLEVRHINFTYASLVLKDISFNLVSGELLAVLGANGAGKSTLLKSMIGLLQLASGEVLIQGKNLKQLSNKKAARLIGYVPQETSLTFPFTVMEFVLQGRFAQGNLIGFESNEDLQEAERAMSLTETTHLAERHMNELSGGERQRVMLARALAARPRLLVLDEPVANLDISHQVKLFELMQQLTIEDQLAAIVVTHELNLAAEFATRAMLLQAGEILACGKPAEVMTEENLCVLFGANLLVDSNPLSGLPRVTITASHNRANILQPQK